MYFERLNEQNVEHYIAYLKLAMQQEPDMMTVEEIDEEGIRTRLRDSFYEKSTSILAMENNQVAGRIEYHFYGSRSVNFSFSQNLSGWISHGVCELGICFTRIPA